ncbi:MAG: large conductance mechanosensitive channel protein [Candidatus Kaiserbacteria bacterium]|nr:large conductance mechanosensitive channel protein [Candidatus Kaiserbacteria bacterium]
MTGFKNFILRGNVVDLAVGVVIGASFGSVVTALVKDFLTPLIGAIAKVPDFSKMQLTVNGSVFMYGDLINAVISFLLVAAAVYFFVVLPMNKLIALSKRNKEVAPEATPEDVQLLREIRDALVRRQ